MPTQTSTSAIYSADFWQKQAIQSPALTMAIALDRARLAPPMAILTEVLLPRLDGLALCRLIKSDAATENITSVIVLSVLAAEERALTAGADAFMQKPLEQNRLLMIFDQANSKRGLKHEAQ